MFEYHPVPPAVNLTIAEYNDALVFQALRDQLRARRLPVKYGPVVGVVAGGERAPVSRLSDDPVPWPPGAAARSDDRPPTPAETYQLGDPDRRRVGKAGGLEWARGAFRGECWAPSLFGILERAPTLTVLVETRTRMPREGDGRGPRLPGGPLRLPGARRHPDLAGDPGPASSTRRFRHTNGKNRPESPMIWGASTSIAATGLFGLGAGMTPPEAVTEGTTMRLPVPAISETPALYVGDRVRVSVASLGRVPSAPTVVLAVATITTAPDGTKVLGFHWPPAWPPGWRPSPGRGSSRADAEGGPDQRRVFLGILGGCSGRGSASRGRGRFPLDSCGNSWTGAAAATPEPSHWANATSRRFAVERLSARPRGPCAGEPGRISRAWVCCDYFPSVDAS